MEKAIAAKCNIALANYHDKTAGATAASCHERRYASCDVRTAVAVVEIVNESNQEMIHYFKEQKVAATKKTESLENVRRRKYRVN